MVGQSGFTSDLCSSSLQHAILEYLGDERRSSLLGNALFVPVDSFRPPVLVPGVSGSPTAPLRGRAPMPAWFRGPIRHARTIMIHDGELGVGASPAREGQHPTWRAGRPATRCLVQRSGKYRAPLRDEAARRYYSCRGVTAGAATGDAVQAGRRESQDMGTRQGVRARMPSAARGRDARAGKAMAGEQTRSTGHRYSRRIRVRVLV